jgi:hypothetical protein
MKAKEKCAQISGDKTAEIIAQTEAAALGLNPISADEDNSTVIVRDMEGYFLTLPSRKGIIVAIYNPREPHVIGCHFYDPE